MAQENVAKDKTPTKTTSERSVKGELFDWLTNNLFFAILPLFVSYLALSITQNPATILERGDAFIITAALLAPEIAALRNLKPDKITSNVKSLLNVMFLLVILSTILFVTSTTDYNASHPDVPINEVNIKPATVYNDFREAQTKPPFPLLTPPVVDVLSAIMLIITILLVYYSIRERRRTGGDS